MESLRVRLMFEDRHLLRKSQRSQGLNRCWLLLKPHQHPNFSDLSAHLLHNFELHRSCPNGLVLSMDGFVLPPFESTCILKDKDIVSVRQKGGISLDNGKIADEADSAVELESVEKQPEHTGVPLLANGEFEKEAGGYQDDSEEDKEQSEEPSLDGNPLSKKRKASRKLRSPKKKKHRVEGLAVDKDDQTDQFKSPRKRKTSNAKSKQDKESTPESAERSISPPESTQREKSDQLQENDEKLEDMSPAATTTKKVPSRSARRKKAKRQWLRNMAKIGKKEVVCNSERPLSWKQKRDNAEKKEFVCNSERPLKWKQRRDKAEKNEDFCPSKGLLHWKKSQEEHHENNVETKKASQKSGGEGEIVPIVVRPGHIRFGPLEEEDQAVQQSQVPVMETFQWNGITSKKKGQKWGLEKISAAGRSLYQNFNKEQHSDMSTTIEKQIRLNGPIDFDKLLPLTSLPKVGDVIAYRLLELSSTWTPELSSFRVGRVLWYKPESGTILLIPVPEYPVTLDKLDEVDESEMQQDNSLYKEDGSLEIDFSSLVDIRIVKHNSDYVKAGTDKVNEGPPGTVNAVSNLVAGNHDKQKHTANTGNGEVNLWDRFSETLTAKKVDLSEGSSWTKWNPSKSSYKPWRGSALGPTMARLRSKKGI